MRAGSLAGVLQDFDRETLAKLLEDYALSRRRERASRADFAAGWVAAWRRAQVEQEPASVEVAA